MHPRAREGGDAVLPRLIVDVGAETFHGLIRTAHPIESDHEPEPGAALGYWSVRWLVLPPPQAEPRMIAADWFDALDKRLRATDAGWTPPGRLLIIGSRQKGRG